MARGRLSGKKFYMKIFCLRIGDKYGPEYEDYINKMLNDYEVVWIREAVSKSIPLQWNKIQFMNLDTDDPIVVLDIDIILRKDYKELFEYPIERGEFLSIPAWWNSKYPKWKINGGFQKYYPRDCKYIYEAFMKNPKHWMMHYIKQGLTIGPVNGEQFFVEEHVKDHLDLKLISKSWVTRWTPDDTINKHIELKWEEFNDSKLIEDEEFNSDIKLIHFTSSLNKPHLTSLWK